MTMTISEPAYVPGWSINVRMTRDSPTEFLAVFPRSYNDGRGGRYYIALDSNGEHVELTPEFVTRRTRPALTFPKRLYDIVCRRYGYRLNVCPRVYG